MIPTHKNDFALLFGCELLFQPMQLYTEIAVKMYEVLSMYDQAKVSITPTMFWNVGHRHVPPLFAMWFAQSAGHKIVIDTVRFQQQFHGTVKVGFCIAGHFKRLTNNSISAIML
jgi:hypothetical protein